MKLNRQTAITTATLIALTSSVAIAHPGHEPEDLLHALAHEIASPRGIFVLLVIGVGIGLWAAHKARSKK
jgi:hydrogenase/urease accessory protein HupE